MNLNLASTPFLLFGAARWKWEDAEVVWWRKRDARIWRLPPKRQQSSDWAEEKQLF